MADSWLAQLSSQHLQGVPFPPKHLQGVSFPLRHLQDMSVPLKHLQGVSFALKHCSYNNKLQRYGKTHSGVTSAVSVLNEALFNLEFLVCNNPDSDDLGAQHGREIDQYSTKFRPFDAAPFLFQSTVMVHRSAG